jgi:hypothetical protein
MAAREGQLSDFARRNISDSANYLLGILFAGGPLSREICSSGTVSRTGSFPTLSDRPTDTWTSEDPAQMTVRGLRFFAVVRSDCLLAPWTPTELEHVGAQGVLSAPRALLG